VGGPFPFRDSLLLLGTVLSERGIVRKGKKGEEKMSTETSLKRGCHRGGRFLREKVPDKGILPPWNVAPKDKMKRSEGTGKFPEGTGVGLFQLMGQLCETGDTRQRASSDHSRRDRGVKGRGCPQGFVS